MKLPSILQNLLTAPKNGLSRFTIPTAFVVALTAFIIAMVMDVYMPTHVKTTLIYYLGVGTLLSFVLQLWSEEVESRRTALIVNIVAHAALIADAVYIYMTYDAMTWAYVLSRASVVVALALAVFFVSFFREKNDVASWNFTWRTLLNSHIVCPLIAYVVAGGIYLLLEASAELFGFRVSNEVEGVTITLFGFLLPMLLFFGLTPQGEAKHDREPVNSKFLNGVTRYILLPLVGLYVVVLYIYGLKILISWELPKGMVSVPISICMLGCVVVETLLYPARQAEGNQDDDKIARYLPAAILPLLVLMTVGIGRRIADYGITITRLYALTLNIWFYAVCIGLYVGRARRISWVPMSFAAVCLATSALPVVNYANLTRCYMHNSVSGILDAANVTDLPLTEERYEALMKELPADTARTLNSQLRYLGDNFGREEKAKYYTGNIPYEAEATTTPTVSNSIGYHRQIPVPAGFNTMYETNYNSTNFNESDGDTIELTVYYTSGKSEEDDDAQETVFVKISELRKHADDENFKGIITRTEHGKFVITYFTIDDVSQGDYYLEIHGYLFLKK